MNTLHIFHGTVEEGHKRGKRLGFPTINMSVTQPLPSGIFASQTKLEDKTYNSLTFIGAAETYNEFTVKAETYIFDFTRDIYGQTATISLLKKIRDGQKFESEEALIKRMEQDKREALEFFKN